MGCHNPVPLFWKAPNSDEQPVDIKERDEQEADGFTWRNLDIPRLDKTPCAMQVDKAKNLRP